MKNFEIWLATSPIASYLRVLLSFVVAQAVAEWARVGYFDFSKWQAWLIAGLAATIPPIMRKWNVEDKAF
jgi:hypothetical protein